LALVLRYLLQQGSRMYKHLWILILLISHSSFAYVDLNLQYSHTKRRIEGVEQPGTNEKTGDAITSSDGYMINWAWYMWDYTALELNYSKTTERLIDKRATMTTDQSIKIEGIDSAVVTEVQGAGIRQSLAPRTALFIPSISIGYARLTTSGKTKYLLDVSGTKQSITLERDKETFNSSYATFQLRIRISEFMGFTLAAKTVMPDFETKQATNNLTYSAGFSWVF
jgi:hypothetical protein